MPGTVPGTEALLVFIQLDDCKTGVFSRKGRPSLEQTHPHGTGQSELQQGLFLLHRREVQQLREQVLEPVGLHQFWLHHRPISPL